MRWMLHDGSYRGIIYPFDSRESAEAWRAAFGVPEYVVEPLLVGLEDDLPPEGELRTLSQPGGRSRRYRHGEDRKPAQRPPRRPR